MDASVRSHLFEPFFTTKEKGKGTGLGLSIVYGAVQQFSGFVEVDSAPNEGTEFRLFFPSAPRTLVRAKPKGLEPVRGGPETILLVEDEESLRQLVSRVLRSYGYRVVQARNGSEGVTAFAGMPQPPDLVLSDIVMPQMGGPQMVEELRKDHPGLKVLFMSGFTGEFSGDREARAGATILMKPFTAETIAQRVRQLLDEPPAPESGQEKKP
jgi:CheY-like chemotaxis protein